MSEDESPKPRAFSPWWSLLLLPVALLVGWLIPNLPQPAPRARIAPAAEQTASAPAIDRMLPPGTPLPARAPAASGGFEEPAPAPIEPPRDDPQAGGGLRWASLREAMDEAKRSGKPVMIDFSAEWCGPCRMLKREVFDVPVRARAVESVVVPVSVVDRTREDGSNPAEIEDLQRRFQVRAFPTLVVYSPVTNKAVKQEGYLGVEGTGAWLAQAAEAVR